MALFKINKGLASNLAKNMPYAKEGFAYFTKDDGKFYIDIEGDGTTTKAVVDVNRIPLNAAKADVAATIQATAMATDDNKVYPILAFNITDSAKNLVEAKYGQIGIKNGTLVIPSVEDKDEILISNEGLGRGIVIDNKGTNNAIEILNGKGIKVAQDPTEDLELATKQYVDKGLKTKSDNTHTHTRLTNGSAAVYLDGKSLSPYLSRDVSTYATTDPTQDNVSTQLDLGDSSHFWSHLYLSGDVNFKTTDSRGSISLTEKLSEKSNTDHTHDDRYYTESEIDTKLSTKSDTSHNHDSRYYTESEIDTKLKTKSDTSHIHDDRYYTESEMDTKLSKKSDTNHTHTKSEITDFAHTHTKADITDFAHTHQDFSATRLNNEDLDNYLGADKMGWYYAGGSNTVSNKPSNVDAFGLLVWRSAEGYYTQTLVSANKDSSRIYTRQLSGSGATPWITTYTSTEIDSKLNKILGANDAMIFRGVVNSNADLPSTHETGWTYRVGTAGTYANAKCEVGDLIICTTDGLSANATHWIVVQANIDGAVIGPASATDGNIALFNGATGKLIKDSGKKISDFAPSEHNHIITANANDDDIVVLTGTNGTNAVTYNATHAKKGPSTTTDTVKGPSADVSISGAGGSGSIKIPKVTVDAYGHTIGLTEQTLTVTIPKAYSHPTGNGNQHIPAGGSAGQILRWASNGTAVWGADNDTHHQSSTVITNGSAETSNAASSNGSTYLNHIENKVVRSTHKIVGAGSTEVSSDANGVLTITSKDTVYSHPTTPGNIHLPAGGKAGDVLLCVGDNTGAGKWGIDPNIQTAIDNLDVNEVGGGGKYIQAIKQVDGKIVATAETIDTALSTSSTKPVQNKVINTALGKKVDTTTFNSHVTNTTIHITADERSEWNSAYTHSQSAHAPTDAEKNQNAFSNIQLNTDDKNIIIKADNATDTVILKSGNNIQIDGDVDTDTITISATDTKYNNATTSTPGLMSKEDKVKLDGIASGANNYSHPTSTKHDPAAVKVGNDAEGHVVLGGSLTKSDVGLGNVGNFLAVSTVANQNLTDAQKSNARANIGAGTSSLVIGTGANNAAAGNHTHKYAGSNSVGGPANSTKGTLTLTAGSNTQTFNGSADKTFTITASDLGLSTAMHFIGIATKGPITDNFDPGIANYGFTKAQTGDVIISKDGDQEYVLIIKTDANNNKVYHWELLGPNGSYAISGHKHSSADITSMGGYSKGNAEAAISANDNLNVAIGKLECKVDNKVSKVNGKNLSTNDFTNAYKDKLDKIEAGAEKNQPAFSNVVVGETTIAAIDPTDSLIFEAGSNVTLSPDATSKKLTIASINTDTKVTAVGNHYTPAEDPKAALSAKASSSTAATWGTTQLVTGVNLQRDTKGHVTGVTVNSIKMPANPNTDTHQTSKNIVGASEKAIANAAATNGNVYLNHLENTTITSKHKITGTNGTSVTSDSSGNITISHTTSGVTAGTYKSVTVNTQGHVTAGTNPTTLAGFGITDAKKTQSAKSSPAASGNSLAFIDTISQDEQGVITATKKTVQNATKTQAGAVSTSAQTFGGAKTFASTVTVGESGCTLQYDATNQCLNFVFA